MPDPDAAAVSASRSSGPPAWVLLDTHAYIGRRRNATTATALTSDHRTVEVSFVLADPPGVSVCYVHCAGMPEGAGVDGEQFAKEPEILTAAGALVLMRMVFTCSSDQDVDCFVYRAGPGRPSLHLLPRSYQGVLPAKHVGILPSGDVHGDGEHFVVVRPILRMEPRAMYYDIHFFSSKCQMWSTKVARLDADPETSYFKVASHQPSKVMAAGGGSLAWLDPWQGVLLCNVLDENPMVQLIQLPSPSPQRRNLSTDGRQVRDATVSSGVIMFVEVKFHDTGDGDGDPDVVAADHGWTTTIRDRATSSKDWHGRLTVDAAEVLGVSNSLPAAWDGEADKLALHRLRGGAPILSLRGADDVVYMMYMPEAWVLAVNAREKTLGASARSEFDAENIFWLEPTYLPCAFSKYTQCVYETARQEIPT